MLVVVEDADSPPIFFNSLLKILQHAFFLPIVSKSLLVSPMYKQVGKWMLRRSRMQDFWLCNGRIS